MAAKQLNETWSSRFTFIMAAVGSAVGLGNFWRFPYEAGQNGGAAFVIVYMGAVLFIALPVLMAEYSIGRRTRMASSLATAEIARESGGSSIWSIVGWVGMIAGFLILTFYSMIAGWVMAYVPMFFSGTFAEADYAMAAKTFGDLTANPQEVLIWHSAFMAITVLIVSRGLNGGIEIAANVLMPAFFIMLAGMVIYSLVVGDAAAAFAYMFSADFSKIETGVALSAISQAFFSVGVASAIMISYGAYLDKDTKISRSAPIVAGTDTIVALLAGIAIFPLVFKGALDPAGGPGLLFITMPTAIAQLPLGSIVGGLFFLLAFFAALTSAISLLEVTVGWGTEKTNLPRWVVAIIAGLLCWVVGIGSVLSFSGNADFTLATWTPLKFGIFEGQNFFGIVDALTDKFMLPLGGLLLALLAGWVVKPQIMREEMSLSGGVFLVWQFLMRFAIPVAIYELLIRANLSAKTAEMISIIAWVGKLLGMVGL